METEKKNMRFSMDRANDTVGRQGHIQELLLSSDLHGLEMTYNFWSA